MSIQAIVTSGYTASFGLEWKRFSKTQLDRFNGTHISRDRFFMETRWNREWMKGKKILDAGCGPGRFTQIALDAGAEVYACDRSVAVDACRKNFKSEKNLHVIQADLFCLPFPKRFFDAIYSLGVLQHTPAPEKAFKTLVTHLKPGGKMAIDVYPRSWRFMFQFKYFIRPFLKSIQSEKLLSLCERYVPPLFRISDQLLRIPLIGKMLHKIIPIANYRGILLLSDQQLIEWAVLETFDALSPHYDYPQTIETVKRWFKESGFLNAEVELNGSVIGRGELCAG